MASGISRLLMSRWLAWLLVGPLLLLLGLTTLQYQQIENETGRDLGRSGSMLVADARTSDARILNDYEDFYIVGRLFREGDSAAAYDNIYLTAAQKRFTGTTTFMPWAYPPPLTAAVALLPLAGLSWSYALFTVATLMLYLWTLSRFGSQWIGASLLAVYPALLLVIRLGQNGMLTGSLIGLFLYGLLNRRTNAGVPLGLMVIKPHLALGIGLVALLQRRWKMIGVAAIVGAALCLGATAVLGFRVWPSFFAGIAAAGEYLRDGLFPLYRMSSIYAGVRSFGLSSADAMAVHAIFAALALGSVFMAWKRGMRTHRLLAVACLATLFISPYNYDYDLVCLAVAVSLILPELLARAHEWELIAFYVLSWIGTGAGLVQHFNAVLIAGTTVHAHGSPLNWSFQAIGLLLAAGLVCIVLRRGQSLSIVPDLSSNRVVQPRSEAGR